MCSENEKKDHEVNKLEWKFRFNRPGKHLGISPFAGMSEEEIRAETREALKVLGEAAERYFEMLDFKRWLNKPMDDKQGKPESADEEVPDANES